MKGVLLPNKRISGRKIMNTKYALFLFFMLVCGIAMINTPVVVSAEEITGIPDDTPGVFLFATGGEESSPGACDGIPADAASGVAPTVRPVQDGIDFGIFEYVGDEPEEILEFLVGGENESAVSGLLDLTVFEVLDGLIAIDSVGDIPTMIDDNANFDAGTSGEFYGGFRNPFQLIVADGIISDGILGGEMIGADSEVEADANLGGMDIFIYEDSELSGFQLELYGPERSWIINIDDFQINPGTLDADDDVLIGIDLDSLPNWDGNDILDLRITDDGVEQGAVDSCDGVGAVDQSIEIDAILARTSVAQPSAVSLNNQAASGSTSLLWMVIALSLTLFSLPLIKRKRA